MIKSIQISGFKNFKGKTLELNNLKKINLLIGINGSGKSSILELLAGVSKLHEIGIHSSDIPQRISVGSLAPRLHSLFEPEAELKLTYTNGNIYRIKVITQAGNTWQIEREGAPVGGTEVLGVWRQESTPYNTTGGGGPRHNRPFNDIVTFNPSSININDIDLANRLLKTVNDAQREIRRQTLSGGQFLFEAGEIRQEFLAGGTRAIACLIAAARSMRSDRKSLLLIDDLGDELFPALRKLVIPTLDQQIDKFPGGIDPQVFATSHNIEMVKSAIDNSEYCSVYMLDYDGTLVEFSESGQKNVQKSSGLPSSQAIPAISKMLGMSDMDLGFPELVILSEEETKKSFLEGLKRNTSLGNKLKKFELQIPFQAGDGNTHRAINNLLDLSKYFFFSEIWSNRYVIFLDYNVEDYQEDGVANSDSQRQKAILAAQSNLVLGERFLLTKKGNSYVLAIEETYPRELWDQYKASEQITENSIREWLDAQSPRSKGQAKNKLAEFVGLNISDTQFSETYPELWTIIKK